MYCHDLEVMASNPVRVKRGVCRTSKSFFSQNYIFCVSLLISAKHIWIIINRNVVLHTAALTLHINFHMANIKSKLTNYTEKILVDTYIILHT